METRNKPNKDLDNLRKYFMQQQDPSVSIPGTCPYCDQDFADLRNHLKTKKIHSIPEDGAYFTNFDCDICQLILPDEECIQSHIENIHVNGRTKDIISCKVCDIDFISPKSLNFHRALCHEDQTSNPLKIKMVPSSVQLHPCNYCGKRFTHFFIKKHMMEKHGTIFREMPPLRRIGLQNMEDVRDSTKLSEFVSCQFCQKQFTNIFIKKHLKIKHNYEEKEMNLALKNSKFWHEIIKSKVKSTGIKLTSCQLCGQQIYEINLQRHLMTKHNIAMDRITNRNDNPLAPNHSQHKSTVQHQRVLRSHRKNQDLKRIGSKYSMNKYLCRYCFIQFKSNEEKIDHVETEHADKFLKPNVKINQKKTANNVKKVFHNNEVIDDQDDFYMDLEHFDEATEAIEFDPMDIEELKVYERIPFRIGMKEVDGECIQCGRYFENLNQHCRTVHANQPVYNPTYDDLASSNLKQRKARMETEQTSNGNTQRHIKKRPISPNIPTNNSVELAFGQKTFKKQYFLPPETMIKPVVNIAELDQTMFDDISPMTDLQQEKQLKEPLPEPYEIPSDVLTGKVALCKNCGCYSEDFEKCCNKKVIKNILPPPPSLIPLVPKPEIKTEIENYLLSCKICNENFLAKSKLEEHIAATHMNVKFSCTECDQTFTKESVLTNHFLQIHQAPPDSSTFHDSGIMDSAFQSKIEETSKHFLDSLLVEPAKDENSVQDTKEGIIKKEIVTTYDSDNPSTIQKVFTTKKNMASDVKDLDEARSNCHDIIPDDQKNKVLNVKLKKPDVRDSKNLESNTKSSKTDTTEEKIPTGAVDKNNSVQDSKRGKMGIEKKNDKETNMQEKFIDESSTKANTKIPETSSTNSVNDFRRKIGAKEKNMEIRNEKLIDENKIRKTAMNKPNVTNYVEDSQPETITRKVKQEKSTDNPSKVNAIRAIAKKKPNITNSDQDFQPETITRKVNSIKQEQNIDDDSSKENTTQIKAESKPLLKKKDERRGRPPGSKNKVHEGPKVAKMDEDSKKYRNGTDSKISDADKEIHETSKKKPHTKNFVQESQPEKISKKIKSLKQEKISDDSTNEMIKSIKQEKYTEDPTEEDDVKRKEQSVEDSSLELALKHSRELLIIKKEISDSYNDQENDVYYNTGRRIKIKQEPNSAELDFPVKPSSNSHMIDQAISTTNVDSKDGENGKENKLRKTRQKKVPAQEAKENLALKESKVNIIVKGKNSNQKAVKKTITKTTDSKYDITKIAKEINMRQNRQKQSSIETSNVVLEDSITNSENEMNFRKTRKKQNTFENSKAIKISEPDIIKQDTNKNSSIKNSKANVNIKQEISAIKESKFTGSDDPNSNKENTITQEKSAVVKSKNLKNSQRDFDDSTKENNFIKKTGGGGRLKQVHSIEKTSSKVDVRQNKANFNILSMQEGISVPGVDAENTVKDNQIHEKNAQTNKTQCYICGKLTSNSNIKGHMKGFHGEYSVKMHGPTKGPCPFKCGYKSSNTDNDFLKEHIEKNHKKVDSVKKTDDIVNVAAKHACNVCNQTFENQKIMKRHFRQKHLSVKCFTKS